MFAGRIIKIILLISGIILSLPASGKKYYIRNGGNDRNSGLTDASAWANHPWMKSWNGTTILKPGDTVFMKCNSSWKAADPARSLMMVAQDGSKMKHIVTTWYGGPGVKPLIQITGNYPFPVIQGIGRSYITFDHLQIRHYSSERSEFTDHIGIAFGKDGSGNISHDWVITNCDIHDIPNTGIAGSGDSYNIFIGDTSATRCATSTDYSNHIFDCGYAGVGMGGCNPKTHISNWKVIYNFINRIDYHSKVEQDSYGIAFSSALASSGWPSRCYARFNLIEDVINWHGLDVHGGEEIFFQDNFIHNCRGAISAAAADRKGLATPVLKHCYIERNIIENSGNHPTRYFFGIFVGAENKQFRVHDCHINGNSISYTARPSKEQATYGIYVLSTDSVIIEKNHIFNGPLNSCTGAIHIGSIDFPVRSIIIQNNFIINWSWAVNLEPEGIDGEIVIHHNVIYSNNRTIGTSTTGAFSGNVRILNNTILTDPDASAPYIIYFRRNSLPQGISLIIKNNIIGFTSHSYLGKYITIPSLRTGRMDIDYNLYWNCKNFFPFQSNTSSTWSRWKTSGFDRNGLIDSNPEFNNANNSFLQITDFKLRSNSPAIGKGTFVGLDKDYAGIPSTGNPDIGAFEHQ